MFLSAAVFRQNEQAVRSDKGTATEENAVTRVDGIVFDLDGTLWDTRAVCARGWNKVIRRSGLDVPEVTAEIVGSIMGLEPDEIARRIFPSLPDQVRNPLMERCYQAEVMELRSTPSAYMLYPGVLDGLEPLSARFRLCVVSNCQAGYLEAFMEHSGAGRFLVDGECIGRTGKSKADNVRLVAERQQLKAMGLVGDTDRDEAAAREAGVDFIHASYGFGTASNDSLAVRSFAELVRLLLEI